jgi:hypothetical protein
MYARFATSDSYRRKAFPRHWRSLLAGLISLALILCVFHGFAFDGDADTPAMSIAQAAGDASGKAPAPLHGDHCLSHVSSVAAQETAFVIEYAPHAYRLASMPAPDTADLLSPFEPPRV